MTPKMIVTCPYCEKKLDLESQAVTKCELCGKAIKLVMEDTEEGPIFFLIKEQNRNYY